MARHKDSDWCLPEGSKQPSGLYTHSYECIQTALLMDIRDELKSLNALLHCTNFTGIPWELTRMRRGIDKLNERRTKKTKTP